MNVPLATQFDQYIQYCAYTKQLRAPTIKGYEDIFRQFQALMPEITHAEQLSAETIDAFFVRLQLRSRNVGNREVSGVKSSTLRTYGSKLRSFFQWLCARGHLVKNPIAAVKLAKAEYNDKRALKREEIEKILSAITQHAPNRFLLKRDLAIAHVLLFTGLRRTELLSLKVADVDVVRRTVTVQGATSKSQTTRHVPLNAACVMQLEDYFRERRELGRTCEYLWTSSKSDTPLTTHGLKHWVDTLRVRSGVRFHVHRFRHTFACMLGRTNVSVIKIQKLMGHTDLRMTQSYMRSLGVEDVRDSVQHLTLDSLTGL
ncbi:MAG: site-specific integrase [Pseudomonadota bacterium]